jgi:hypothetical protein
MVVPITVLALALLCPAALPAGPAAAPQEPEKQQEGKGEERRSKAQARLEETFLAAGTVFDADGLALSGAEIRVRRQSERRIRWRTRTDRRGEFAVRFPRGAEYVLEVVARGYAPEEQKLDARHVNRQDLVFRLQPENEGGPK